jgi:hypothetical protein
MSGLVPGWGKADLNQQAIPVDSVENDPTRKFEPPDRPGCVMPSIPCANANIPTIMAAERLADLIRREAAAV